VELSGDLRGHRDTTARQPDHDDVLATKMAQA
jgi:hypothetical protein